MTAVEPGKRIDGEHRGGDPGAVPPAVDQLRPRLGRAATAHPNRSAPRRRHSTSPRVENGSPDSGCTVGSLRTRSSMGSMPSATASSSIAHSSPKLPGASPGARM